MSRECPNRENGEEGRAWGGLSSWSVNDRYRELSQWILTFFLSCPAVTQFRVLGPQYFQPAGLPWPSITLCLVCVNEVKRKGRELKIRKKDFDG